MSGDPVFYGPWSLTIEAGLGLVGIVANSICAHHTRKHFPVTKMAIFALAYLDALVSLVGGAVHCLAILTYSLAEDKSVPLCSFPVLAGLLTHLSGTIITAEVAIVRLYSIYLSRKNETVPERKALRICLLVLMGYISFFVFTFISRITEGKRTFYFIDACADEERPENTKSPNISGASMVSVLAVAVVANVAIACYIRKLKSGTAPGGINGNQSKPKQNYTVPLRAITLSTLLLVFFALRRLLWPDFLEFDQQTVMVAMSLSSAAVFAARSSLTMALTFKAKERADVETREQKQERERQWARKAREERKGKEEDDIILSLEAVKKLTGNSTPQDQDALQLEDF